MKSDVLIVGAGYIGKRLKDGMKGRLCGEKIARLEDAERLIKRYDPGVIINCIGHTGGRNVDACERDKDKTLRANSFVPLLLAEAAIRGRIKLVHISTGCIFRFDPAKDRPVTEDKAPDFFDLFYSRSKITSDVALEILSRRYDILVIRIRLPLDDKPHPKNILTKLIHYKKIADAPNSVTYLPDLARALKHLIKIKARGVFHVVNKGSLRYPELLEIYKEYVPDHAYEVVRPEELGLVRTDVVMSARKLEKTGFKVRHIREVLPECVKNYLKY